MRDWAGPDETLEAQSFERLYRGALLLESKVRRIRGGALVLLTGRLGLALEEALHLHEGWIDWEQAVIEIPEKDPCACAACWETARERRTHIEPVTDALYEECWSPPESRTARTVPFGWSPRVTAALATVYDRWDVLDMSPEEARTSLEAAGRKADDVAVEDATPATLSPTAARSLLDLGLSIDATATMLGVHIGAVEPYADDQSDPAAQLARLAGDAAVKPADPSTAFPVALGTEAYPAEPFGLNAVDADVLAGRATDAPDPDRVPREVDRPGSVDYDASDHERAGPPTRRDPVATPGPGGPGQHAAGGGQPTQSQATAADGPLAPESPSPPQDLTDVEVPAMDDEPAVGDPAAGDPTQPTAPSGAAGGTSPSTPGGSTAGEATGRERATGSAGGSSPRDAVTQPVVADVSTRIAADGIAGGRETDGRIVLGQEELFVLESDADGTVGDPGSTPHAYVRLDDVWDVKIDHVPRRLDASFRRTVTVVYRPADADRHAVAVQLPPSQREDLADALYRLLLNVTPATVTDPARVAGRVTDADPEPMVMYVRPGRLAFADEAGKTLQCSFDLDDVVHVDRTERDDGGDAQSVVEVRRVTDNRPRTTTVDMPDARRQRLAWRYVRREYHRTLSDVRKLRLSDSEKMILVALYSTDGTPDLRSILGLDEQELEGALQSLEAKHLIRAAEASTSLTGRGQLVVSDRLDSVND